MKEMFERPEMKISRFSETDVVTAASGIEETKKTAMEKAQEKYNFQETPVILIW